MIRDLYLEHVGPVRGYGLSVGAGTGFGARLNLFTGDNGLGKTFVLDALWYLLTGTWAGVPVLSGTYDPGSVARLRLGFDICSKFDNVYSVFDYKKQKWQCDELYSTKLVNHTQADFFAESINHLIISMQLDGGFCVWDAAKHRGGHTVAPIRLEQSEVWSGQGKRCNGLLRDWVVWQYKQSDAFKRLCAVMAALAPHTDEPLRPGQPMRVSEDEAAEIPTLIVPYGEVPITHASAGIRRILGMAYALVWAWEEHLVATRRRGIAPAKQMILLLDEVEAHLHPQWQRVLLPALLEAIRLLQAETEVQVFATTHAPLVLASVEPMFDPVKDRLYNFELDGERRDRIRVEQVPFVRYGDVSNWLRSGAFDMKLPMSREAESALLRAQALMRSPAAADADLDAADLALRAAISDTNPFYTRWDAFRAARYAQTPTRT